MTIYYLESGFLFPVLTPLFTCEQSAYFKLSIVCHNRTSFDLFDENRVSPQIHILVSVEACGWSFSSSHGLGVAPHDPHRPHPPTMVLRERVECVSGRQKPDNRPHTQKNLIDFEKNKRFDKKTKRIKKQKCLLLHF